MYSKSMSTKKDQPVPLSDAALVPWNTFLPHAVFPLEKGSRAGVVMDREGKPQLFVFDTYALLDVLSTNDEKLVDLLSDEAYASKEKNPTGWLIDEIEARLPLKTDYIESLKQAISEAKRDGWTSLETLEKDLPQE